MLKSRDITLPIEVHIVKMMVFPVATYACESYTIKKLERQRIDAFKLWCRRRLMKVPWKERSSNQSILREINPENSLERLLVKLKLQDFGHLIWTANSLEKSLVLGKRASEDEMAGWHNRYNGHELWQTSGGGEGQGGVVCCSPWGRKESDTSGWLNNHSNWINLL